MRWSKIKEKDEALPKQKLILQILSTDNFWPISFGSVNQSMDVDVLLVGAWIPASAVHADLPFRFDCTILDTNIGAKTSFSKFSKFYFKLEHII